MIKVVFKHDDDCRYLRLEVKGHSNSAPLGEDLICASASILTYTLNQIILVAANEGKLVSNPVLKVGSGDAVIACRCKDEDAYSEMINAFYVVQIGFYLLQHNFPENITVESKGGIK
jgi:uncharacterized protein YsxB (DUF464 family)